MNYLELMVSVELFLLVFITMHFESRMVQQVLGQWDNGACG